MVTCRQTFINVGGRFYDFELKIAKKANITILIIIILYDFKKISSMLDEKLPNNITVLLYLRIYFGGLSAVEKSCFEAPHTTSCVMRTALDPL